MPVDEQVAEQAPDWHKESEMKKLATEILHGLFYGVLNGEVFQRRAAAINSARFLARDELQSFFEHQRVRSDEAEGIGGLVYYEWDGGEATPIVIIEKQSDPLLNLYALVHEGVHLMSQDAHITADFAFGDKRTSYIGPLRVERNAETGEVEEAPSREDKLFWEAVTDWAAIEGLRSSGALTAEQERELDQFDKLGFVERSYIAFLVREAPHPSQMKEQLLRGLTAKDLNDTIPYTFGWDMYDDLLAVFRRYPDLAVDTWEDRVDEWMATVVSHFESEE